MKTKWYHKKTFTVLHLHTLLLHFCHQIHTHMKSVFFVLFCYGCTTLSSCFFTSRGNDEYDLLRDSIPLTPFLENVWEKIHADTEARHLLKEYPIDSTTFANIVSFVTTHGTITECGPDNILCGKKYVFTDSSGTIHIFQAIQRSSFGEASRYGNVQSVYVYGYFHNQNSPEYYFRYSITPKNIRYPFFTNTIENFVDTVLNGSKQFIRKVHQQKNTQ